MSKLAHSYEPTMRAIERQRMIEDGLDPDRCPNCGAVTNGDSHSIDDDRICWYCKAD